ncbi:MAG: hypothetical protein Q9M37_05180 [Desulfonauticus sp.]|nr:hypothetical protein [Desulfonauticus sp.]
MNYREEGIRENKSSISLSALKYGVNCIGILVFVARNTVAIDSDNYPLLNKKLRMIRNEIDAKNILDIESSLIHSR